MVPVSFLHHIQALRVIAPDIVPLSHSRAGPTKTSQKASSLERQKWWPSCGLCSCACKGDPEYDCSPLSRWGLTPWQDWSVMLWLQCRRSHAGSQKASSLRMAEMVSQLWPLRCSHATRRRRRVSRGEPRVRWTWRCAESTNSCFSSAAAHGHLASCSYIIML